MPEYVLWMSDTAQFRESGPAVEPLNSDTLFFWKLREARQLQITQFLLQCVIPWGNALSP